MLAWGACVKGQHCQLFRSQATGSSAGEVVDAREFFEIGDQFIVEMGLRPVEQDRTFADLELAGEFGDTIRIGSEQFRETGILVQ